MWKLTRLLLSDRQSYRVVRRVLQDKCTYLDASALVDLYESVRAIEEEGQEGIIIEAGCALGGSAIVITAAKATTRPFYVYDVFGMIPPPSENDGPDAHARYNVIAGGESSGIGGERYYGYEENLFEKVIETFSDFGFPIARNNVYLVKGLYEDSLVVNQSVVLAHIDCDWYESVMTCLNRITPWVVKGGRIIIDDYNTWSGCRRAVDTYFADKRQDFEFTMRARLHIIRRN